MSDYDGPERIQNIITDHSCKHEADLAVMANNIKQILATLLEIKGVIFGNGKEGLRRIQSRQSTMQKIQWWAIGVILITLGGIVANNLM